jgi:SAM-dependent methyltransferase
MDLREYRQAQQARHPWELARARFVGFLLAPLPAGMQVLDVGSGDAWLAEQLLWHTGRIQTITCWDVNYQAKDLEKLKTARDNRLILTAEQPQAQFDTILLCDVLEHVEHDQQFLTHLVANCLKPGGRVIITVPEWQFLFTAHDTTLGHFRRYSPAGMRRLATTAGLEVCRCGQIFFLGLLLRMFEKLRERLQTQPGRTTVDSWSKGPLVTKMARAVLSFDATVTSRLRFVPGLTWWGVCQKRSL